MEKVMEKVMESHGILKLQKVRTLSYPGGKKMFRVHRSLLSGKSVLSSHLPPLHKSGSIEYISLFKTALFFLA